VTANETELKGLMLASLDGDAASYRSLLDRLSGRLRAYYKGKLARVGRGATEAEDLVQEVLLAVHLKTSHLRHWGALYALGAHHRSIQAHRLFAPDPNVGKRASQ